MTENFQAIYKMIEDTFDSSFETETKVKSNTNGIDDGMKEMREVIRMSEENIKQAGRLLERFQRPIEVPSSDIASKPVEMIIEDKSLPTEMLDAARVLGANPAALQRQIVRPWLQPTLLKIQMMAMLIGR